MKKRAVILGAGVSGLAAGYALSKKGFETLVLEKNAYAGGLAATFSHKNYLLDFGPHNFHTRIPGILEFVKDELGIPMQKMQAGSSKLFFMGKFVEYPLRINSAMRNLPLSISLRCLIDYLICRIRLKFFAPKDADSFEGWVKSRFGSFLYDLYFGPYVRKVWGIAGSRLDAEVAKKRILEPSLFSLIVRAITGGRKFRAHPEDPSAIESYYPPNGIGAIADKLKESITSRTGEVLTGCALSFIELPKKKSGEGAVSYSVNGAECKTHFDLLVSTIPLNQFGQLCAQGSAGLALAAETSRLSYRSLILLYLFLDIERLFNEPWVYFNERGSPDLIFNRIYEVGNFSRQMLADNKGCVCLEITCYQGDELWQATDEALFEKCMAYLERNNLLKREHVREILVKRLEVAYPVFEKGYREYVRGALQACFCAGNIVPLGRQGLFSYSNIDHCLDMGLKLDKLLAAQEPQVRPEVFFELYKNYI